jgi:hypothetical protein
MREIAMAFICFASLMVIALWALTIMLAIKSGKGILSKRRSLSAFSQQHKHQWLSIPDTIAQYGGDHMNSND